MYLLGIESSCDETAASVFTDEPRVLSSVVASQDRFHARFGGVVPEVAARAHLIQIIPVIRQALSEANIRPCDLGAVAVQNRPGLVGSLLVGVSAAKMISLALGVPLVGVDHIEGHVYACQLGASKSIFPCLALIVSGGHTLILDCPSATESKRIGQTRDDAAGEALDKAAAMMGLGFPGGPALDRIAQTGNPNAYDFPMGMPQEGNLDFSFSGLKTALLYTIRKLDHPLSESQKGDLAASFLHTVVKTLVKKCKYALKATGHKRLAVGGGVAVNNLLRNKLGEMTANLGVELILAPPEWCTDNAAMAAVAVEHLRLGRCSPLDLDALPC
jgi:N6-L-threonylcarbamoyladenine synthase